MVDEWYDYQTLSTIGYSESNITENTGKEITEKDKKQNTIWKKIVMMALLFEDWGKVISHGDLVGKINLKNWQNSLDTHLKPLTYFKWTSIHCGYNVVHMFPFSSALSLCLNLLEDGKIFKWS